MITITYTMPGHIRRTSQTFKSQSELTKFLHHALRGGRVKEPSQ